MISYSVLNFVYPTVAHPIQHPDNQPTVSRNTLELLGQLQLIRVSILFEFDTHYDYTLYLICQSAECHAQW
jgi:hypothetical protein